MTAEPAVSLRERVLHLLQREIDAILAQSKPLDGDVYTLERDREGRHGSIMKYNLNKGEQK